MPNDALTEEIQKIFKSEGLQVAEKTAVNAVRAAFKILKFVVPKKSLGLGLVIGQICDIAEPYVLSIIDNIDGEDNPDY